MACSQVADHALGPVVKGCRGDFDFTQFFEESVLGILPSSVFLLLSLGRLLYLRRQRPVVKLGQLSTSKLCAAGGIVILQAAILGQHGTREQTRTGASIPAAALSLVASVALSALSYLEHTRTWRPSSLLLAYSFLTILFDVVKSRTFWLMGHTPLAVTITLDCVVRLALFALESRSKARYFLQETKEKSAEETIGPISKTFFFWLNNLFQIGYGRSILPSDLTPIDSRLYSKHLSTSFSSTTRYGTDGSSQTTAKFIVQVMRCIGLPVLAPAIPRLAMTGFIFSQSFLVTAILKYLQATGSQEAFNDDRHGYGLLGACVFVYVGIAAATSWYWRLCCRFVTMIRGGLVVTIFEKLLRLAEDTKTEAKATTLIISDVQRIVESLTFLHEVWAGVLETALATYLLQRLMGLSCVAMLGLAIASGCCTLWVATKISAQQQVWFGAIEKRIEATKRLLDSLKAVKMRSAEDRASAVIIALRTLEIRAARLFRGLITVSVFLAYSTLTLSPLLVFATYIGTSGAANVELDAARMFSSLVLIALLGAPLIHLFQALPALGAAYGCFQRILEFISIQESTRGKKPRLEWESTAVNGSTRSDVAIMVRDASMGWSVEEPILKVINLKVKKGTHLAVLGKVGSGKSLFMRSLIGEAPLISGLVTLLENDRAFCGQVPWLENLSAEQAWTQHIKDDPGWLKTVFEACCLDDIAALPDYSSGTIGSSGVRLSGGQRQRLALARAVALRKDIVILDDVFSALDRKTKSLIMARLLGPTGLFRRLGTTVVVTTHDRDIANLVDERYEINDEGELVWCSEEEKLYHKMQTQNDSAVASDHEFKTEYGDQSPEKDQESQPGHLSNPEDVASTSEQELKVITTVSDRGVYIRYIRAMGFGNAGVFLIFGIVFAVCLKFPDLWVQWWSDDLAGARKHDNNYWLGIFAMLAILPLFALCIWVLHLMFWIVPTSASSLHASLLGTALNAPFSFISRIDTGSLMNRFNQDLMFVDTFLPLDLFNTCAELFTALFQMILIAIVSYYSLSVLPALVIVLYVIQRVYLRTSKQLRLMDLEWKGALHTRFGETASGLATIRANQWVDSMREKFMEKLDRSQEPFYMLFMAQRWLQLVLELVIAGLAIVIAGVCIALRDKVAAGAVGVAFLNVTTLGSTLTNFIISWTSLETSLGAIARVASFEAETPNERDRRDSTGSAADVSQIPEHWPERGEVHFENVWATYDVEKEHPTWGLQRIDLVVPAGQRTAICGRTGSGKSTLLLALMGMVDVPVGKILVDGMDTSELPMPSLRHRFQVVSQDSFTESASLRREMDPESKFSDEEIIAALKECRVWDKVFLAGGLDKNRADATLSRGEEQLLSISRLILHNSNADSRGGIIILDEATSSLDPEAENMVEQLLATKLKGRTVLSILHRLEAAGKYDKIAVLEQGSLIDYGDARSIVARCALFAQEGGSKSR